MAADVYAWRDVISVGAIDCADEVNTDTCREYDIMGYPSMKFFPRKGAADFLGEKVDVRALTVDAIRDAMTSFLMQEEEKKPELKSLWPALFPINLEQLSDIQKETSRQNNILIIESAESKIGMEVMLDFQLPLKRLNIPLQMRRTIFDPKFDYGAKITEFPSVVYISEGHVPDFLPIKEHTRQGLYNIIKDYLWKESGKFVLQDNKNIFDTNDIVVVDDNINQSKSKKEAQPDNSSKSKKALINRRYTVYLSDLEKAAVYALSHEVAQHQTIAGEALEALRKFITMLEKYFPSRSEFLNVLKDVHYWVHQHEDALLGEDLGSVMKSSLIKYGVKVNDKWVGCQGSKPQYGNYPCGLWSLWHTLTVHHALKKDGQPRDVMEAMKEYIQQYFGCRECARHFDQAILNGDGIIENVNSAKDSVLYLWHIHNKVNIRLSGDMSEDPQYPKLVFPDKDFCFKCHKPTSGTNLWDEFDRDEIYNFMVNQYSNKVNKQGISSTQIQKPGNALAVIDDTQENLDKSNFRKSTNKQLTVNFIFFDGADLSMYMILWLISAIMIILLYLKFVSKRMLRPSKFFASQKVSYNPLLGKV